MSRPVTTIHAVRDESRREQLSDLVRGAGYEESAQVGAGTRAINAIDFSDVDLVFVCDETVDVSAMLAHVRPAVLGLPIIVLSSRADTALANAWLRSGAADVIAWNDRARMVARVGAELDAAQSQRTARRSARDIAVREARLQQAQRLESLGMLASGISHDFNNLLTVILGNCDLLKFEVEGELDARDPVRLGVDQIELAAQRGAALTRQLLNYSRPTRPKSESVQLNRVVSEMEQMFKRLLPAGITFRSELCPTLGHVRVDAVCCEQIVMNLVLNARDAIAQSGEIVVTTDNVSVRPRDERPLHPARAGRYVKIAVRDDGSGMSDAQAARIFEPFYSSKSSAGTGIGLTTVHSIVRDHDGFIDVASREGHGTTIAIHLPAVQQGPAPKSSGGAGARRGNEHILICEDDDLTRRSIAAMLQSRGYQVHAVSSAAAALEMVLHGTERIDLVITDVVLPVMDGITLGKKLAAVANPPAVLYITGYPAELLEEREPQMSTLPVERKPIRMQRLLQRVRQLLDASQPSSPGTRQAASASRSGEPIQGS